MGEVQWFAGWPGWDPQVGPGVGIGHSGYAPATSGVPDASGRHRSGHLSGDHPDRTGPGHLTVGLLNPHVVVPFSRATLPVDESNLHVVG